MKGHDVYPGQIKILRILDVTCHLSPVTLSPPGTTNDVHTGQAGEVSIVNGVIHYDEIIRNSKIDRGTSS